MGFLPEPAPQHRCTLPGPAGNYTNGTRWQCDECAKVYRVVVRSQYNETFAQWER